MRRAFLAALCVATLAGRAFAGPKRGEWVQSDSVGMNLVTYAFDTGKTTGVGDVAASSEFVGLHYFFADRFRVGMNLQFSEYLTDPSPGQSRFATFALLPQIGWNFWGPLFAALVFTIAPWTLGGANGSNDFDLGVQAVFGGGVPIGDRVAVSAAVEVPFTFVVHRTIGFTPLLGVSIRL